MRRWLLGPLLWLLCTPAPAMAEPVSFQLDLGPFLSAGYFDPATDDVEVRGDFNNWNANSNSLQTTNHGPLYGTTLNLPTGPIAYKFVIVRSGGAVVWEDHIPNRQWQVAAGANTIPPAFFADLAAPPGPQIIGADLSHVPQLEDLGAAFRDHGETAELLPLISAAGISLVRLRLWHTPPEPAHGLEATIAYAHQLRAAGFSLLLDLHYSDTWADPGHQQPPSAWQDVTGTALADSVAMYTSRVVDRFVAEGLPLYGLQLGNEIDGGLLWDEGRVGGSGSAWDTPQQWGNMTALLHAAAEAARGSLPPQSSTRLILHLAQGGDNNRCREFFDAVVAAGVDFDVIGVSYYPWWHGSLWQLESNLRDLGPRYGKELMVVETAYPWTLEAADATGNFVTQDTVLPAGYSPTPQGQLDFLRDVRRVAEAAGALGVVYWEPAYVPVAGGPPNPYENLTLFDFAGAALPGLRFGLGGTIPAAAPVPPAPQELGQNVPNPFNPATAITYNLRQAGPVVLKIYDLEGRLVHTLVDTTRAAGRHVAQWSGQDDQGRAQASGVYLYELKTGSGTERRKMMLVR